MTVGHFQFKSLFSIITGMYFTDQFHLLALLPDTYYLISGFIPNLSMKGMNHYGKLWEKSCEVQSTDPDSQYPATDPGRSWLSEHPSQL